MYKLFALFNKKNPVIALGARVLDGKFLHLILKKLRQQILILILKRKGITSIEKLLGPDYSRTQSITVATELALSSENIKNFI